VDVIAYACISGSLVKGFGWDRDTINFIERQTGIPATTTSAGAVKAFQELGIRRVAVLLRMSKSLTAKSRSSSRERC
jgi:maleate cis-trans isomerase